jgi:hypothetical protein
MRSSMTRLGFSATFVTALVVGACDGPTRPAPANTPSSGAGTDVQFIEVAGPRALAPGQTAQFTVIARYADGSSRDVTHTPGVSWHTNNPYVISISPTGLVTALAVGGAAVTVSFGGKTAVNAGIVVLRPGTYRLVGSASDNGVPLSGVRVEVMSGPAAGMVTTANPHYTFWGVSGEIEILATKDGYREQRSRILMTKDLQRLDVELTPLISDGSVEGVYTLTVIAAPECSVAVPHEKTFTAVLTQEGSRVSVTLQGTDFLTWNSRVYNSFKGTRAGNALAFYLGEGSFYDWPDVSQYLTPPTFYFVGGSVTLSGPPSRLEGMLAGTLGVGQYNELRFVVSTSCRSTNHGFELIRK